MTTGVLFFHSETGTEGGWYCWQDEQFMHLPPRNTWWCSRCGRIWDKDRSGEEPKPSFTYWRQYDAQYSEGERTWTKPAAGWFHYGEPHPELEDAGPAGIDREWNKKSNATSLRCFEEGHERWISPQEQHPNGIWSYEGLHRLNNGDHLRVFHPETHELVWEGTVKLQARHDVYTNSEAVVGGGWWVNQEPDVGVDRETWASWFFRQYPCEVEEA